MARQTLRSYPPFSFVYHTIRKISAPEDVENRREVYVGYAPFENFIELPTDENVREYLVDAEGKKRARPTQVHLAMRETLRSNPQNFAVLNGGITIVARGIEVDDKVRTAFLLKPSIINGSQTQGELQHYLEMVKRGEIEEKFSVHVKYELVVTDDVELIGEISIARNFQNDVMTISIAGRRGQLDELEKSFRRDCPGAHLRKSETDLADDVVVTEKLLQVITALVPEELWLRDGEQGNPNKVFTYSMKATCLKDFQNVWNVVKEKADLSEIADRAERRRYVERRKELYQFYLDIAAEAWKLYQKWKQHHDFYGTRIRAIERDGREIAEVPDGIIFPILAALSAFAVKKQGRWTISPPPAFADKELIQAAAIAYKEIANSNPWNMGKSRGCYTQLYQLTSVYRKLARLQQ
ncbi:MAG: AIPR family protein [Planctomycetota bacterium]|nr:AIPR family protein [Planctomycetota bacterium]